MVFFGGCNGIDITFHQKNQAEREAHRAARLQKKAVKLQQKADEYAQRAQALRARVAGKQIKPAQPAVSSCLKQRNVIDNVRGVGDKYFTTTDVRNNFTRVGNVHLNDVTIAGNYSVVGDAILDKVTVTDSVSQVGEITMYGCQLKSSVSVTGRGVITATAIAGDMSVCGELAQFENSSCKAMTLYPSDSSTTLLKSSTVANITVKHGTSWSFFGIKFNIGNNGNKCKKAIIELDGTTVSGDVIFDDVVGTVILRNGAQVIGQVIGGAAGEPVRPSI